MSQRRLNSVSNGLDKGLSLPGVQRLPTELPGRKLIKDIKHEQAANW